MNCFLPRTFWELNFPSAYKVVSRFNVGTKYNDGLSKVVISVVPKIALFVTPLTTKSKMHIVLFEDSAVQRLQPITTGRPAYAISCASFRLLDWLRLTNCALSGVVRDHLVEIQRLDYELSSVATETVGNAPFIAVNARVVPEKKVVEEIRKLIEDEHPRVLRFKGEVVAARMNGLSGATVSSDDFVGRVIELSRDLPEIESSLRLFQWPHDVVSENMRLLNESLEFRLQQDAYTEIQPGVFLAEGATLGDYASVDTSHGPILLDRDVQVGPFCFLSGPVYAGPKTRVIEHAALKDAVSLGHTVKIGGEVEASVIEPYSNKQHHGFLGHSYLGSWINWGAGTCNSDLKNTYGQINMQYGSERVATGMQFMGSIIGDYTKTAINTGIFTGKVIGVCSMLYGFVTSNVPSFVNYARLFGQTAELPADVMIATQQRMFARRKVVQRSCDEQLIRDMHRLTELERESQLGTL